MMEGEDCNTSGHKGDNEIFVNRVAFPKDGEVEEHDRE